MSQQESAGSPTSPGARDGDLASAVLGRAERYSHGVLGLNAGLDQMLISTGGARPLASAFPESTFSAGSYRAVADTPAPPPGAPQDAVTPAPAAAEAPPGAEPASAIDAPEEGASWVRRLEAMAERLEARMMERDTAPPLESIGMPVPDDAAPPQPRPSGRRSRIQEAPAPVTIQPGASPPAGPPAPASETPAPADQPASSARPPSSADAGPATGAGGTVQRTPAAEPVSRPPEARAPGAGAAPPSRRPAAVPSAEPPGGLPAVESEQLPGREGSTPPGAQAPARASATPAPPGSGAPTGREAGLANASSPPAEHAPAPASEPPASTPAAPGPALGRGNEPRVSPEPGSASAGPPDTTAGPQLPPQPALAVEFPAEPGGPAGPIAEAGQPALPATDATEASLLDSPLATGAPLRRASSPAAPGEAIRPADRPSRDESPQLARPDAPGTAANPVQRAVAPQASATGPAPRPAPPELPTAAEASPARPAAAPDVVSPAPARSIQRLVPPEAAATGHVPAAVPPPAAEPSAAAPPVLTGREAGSPAVAASGTPPSALGGDRHTRGASMDEAKPGPTPPVATAGADTQEAERGPTTPSTLPAPTPPRAVTSEGPVTLPAEVRGPVVPGRTPDQGGTGEPDQATRPAAAEASEADVAPPAPPVSPAVSQASPERGTIRRRVAVPQPPSGAAAPSAPPVAPLAVSPVDTPEPPPPGPASESTPAAPAAERTQPRADTGLEAAVTPDMIPETPVARSSASGSDEEEPASQPRVEVPPVRHRVSQPAPAAPSAAPSIASASFPTVGRRQDPSAASGAGAPIDAQPAQGEARRPPSSPATAPAPPVGHVQRQAEPHAPAAVAHLEPEEADTTRTGTFEPPSTSPRVAASRQVAPATPVVVGTGAPAATGYEASRGALAHDSGPGLAPPPPLIDGGKTLAPPPARPDTAAAAPAPAVFPFPLAQRRVARQSSPPAAPASEEKPGAHYQALPLVPERPGPAEPPALPIQRQTAVPGARLTPSTTPSAQDSPGTAHAGTSALPAFETPRQRATVAPALRDHRVAGPSLRRQVVPAAPTPAPPAPSRPETLAPGAPADGGRRVALAAERPGPATGSAGAAQRTLSRPFSPFPGPSTPGIGSTNPPGQVPPGPSEVLQRMAAMAPERPQLPLAPPPARQVVQRVEEPVGSLAKVEPAPGASEPPDIDRIADRVWKKIKRDLRVERERERGMP